MVFGMTGNGVGSQCQALKDYCKKLKKGDPTLTSIFLDGCKIGDAGAMKLADALLRSPSGIETMDLSGNQLTGRGVNVIMRSILGSSLVKASLVALDLSSNLLGEMTEGDESQEAYLALAELMSSCPRLTSVSVYGNSVSASGVRIICDSLQSPSTEALVPTRLSVLNLGRNRIGNDGAMALAEALRTNTSLTWIRLTYNGIDDVGASSFWETLQDYNSTLQTLDLRKNPITKSGYLGLIDSLLEENGSGERRVAASRMAGRLASRVASPVANRVASPEANRVASPLANRVSSPLANRVASDD